MSKEELFLMFRMELEKMVVKDIFKMSNVEEIRYKGKVVGLLIVQGKYIDGLYVLPEYRRKGLGRQAVYEYIKKHGMPATLHIINKNSVALTFWNSIFNLEVIDSNPIDRLYRIKGVKNKSLP